METIYLLDKRNIPIKEILSCKTSHKGTSKIERIEIFRTLINMRLKFQNKFY